MKYLIIGLGNIGQEYTHTRHNIGFKILDQLAEEQEIIFSQERLAFHSEFKFKGRTFHLIKPTTYMNLSGKAVNYWLNQLKLPITNSLIIADDIALPFGKLRLRKKGSDGGHNGLKSIIESMGTTDFPRLRFGIGDDFHKGYQVNFVLSPWTREEENALPKHIDKAIDIVKSFGTIGIERTMNNYN